MTDNQVIKALSYLSKLSVLSHDVINPVLMKLFPKLDFLESGESTKIFIRRFTPWFMDKVASKNLVPVLKSLNLIYPKLYLNKKTLDNYFSTDIRKPISKRFGKKSVQHELSLELTALTWQDKGEVIKKAKEKVDFKQHNRQTFDGNRIINLIKDNINSDDVIRKSIALLLASGCRPIELYAKANFTRVPNEPQWISQDFIAKRRGEIGNPVIKPIVYLTAQQFIDEVAIMREGLAKHYKTIISPKNDQLSSSINSQANEIAKLVFENEEHLTLYSTKKLYGLSSYEIYGKVPNRFGENVAYPSWLQAVYGHASSGAVENYSHFEIKNDEVILEDKLEEKQIPEFDDDPDDAIPMDGDIFKNPKLKTNIDQLEVVYNRWKKNNPKNKLTLTIFEALCKGKAVRRIVRLAFYRFKGKD